MANNAIIPFNKFVRLFDANNIPSMLNYFRDQQIGKVEFVSKPWVTGTNKPKTTKWIVDFENGKFTKFVDGDVEHTEKYSVYDCADEIRTLIRNEKINDYDKVNLIRRTTTEGKNMKPRNIGLMQIVETIVRREVAAKRKRRKLTEASLEKDPVKAYIQTALWSSSDDEDNSLDSQYGYDDVAQESISKAKSDLKSLIQQLKQAKLYDAYMKDYDLSQLAYDFWLTRNGHGTGFWDRDYSTDDLGDKITDIVKKFRPVDAVVGDDGKIYFE